MNILRKHFSLIIILTAVFLQYSTFAVAACTAQLWQLSTQYVRGDIVTYDNNEWRAKRNTQGVIPGTHKPTWAYLGICETEPE